jgi:hypothetical protein
MTLTFHSPTGTSILRQNWGQFQTQRGASDINCVPPCTCHHRPSLFFLPISPYFLNSHCFTVWYHQQKGDGIRYLFLIVNFAENLLVFLSGPTVTTKRLDVFYFVNTILNCYILCSGFYNVLFADYFVSDLIYNQKHSVLSEYIFAQLISFFNIYSESFCIVNKWNYTKGSLCLKLHTKEFGDLYSSPGPTNNSAG